MKPLGVSANFYDIALEKFFSFQRVKIILEAIPEVKIIKCSSSTKRTISVIKTFFLLKYFYLVEYFYISEITK